MVEEKIPKNFSITGLLKRIVSHKASYDSVVTGSSGHSISRTETTTHLEILSDDGKVFPVEFNTYVGNELINERVSYVTESELTTGEVGGRPAREEIVRQRLIPVNNNLPEYLAVNRIYQS